MKMRVIRVELNSLRGKYPNKEIRVMGHNLLLIRLNNDAERDEVIADGPWLIDGVLFHIQKYYNHIPLSDYTFDKQIFTLQFKYLKLEHMTVVVIDEAISFIGKKISTKPRNCIPRVGTTVKARIEMDLNKSLYRGGWWKTVNVEDVWIRYHWELQPKNICPKCFIIDHDDEKSLLKEDSEANKEKKGSTSTNYMEEEQVDEGNIEDSRNVKRMRNSTLNVEPSMNPHNIHVQAHAVMQGHNTINMDHQHIYMMESDNSTATNSSPMNDCVGDSSQVFKTTLIYFNLSSNFIYFFLKMRILCWNVQGLGKKFTKNQLYVLIKKQSSDILFLTETKMDTNRMIDFAKSLKFTNYDCIDIIGLVDGLLLLWKEGFQCSVHDKSNNIINVLASLHPANKNVLISFMYGSTYSEIKKIQWDVMSSISDNIMQPWIVIGDLNVHLHTLDYSTSVSQDDKFVQQKINDCGLMDLGYIGRDFTWSSNKIGVIVFFKRPFKFSAMWLKHAGFKNQLKIAWHTNTRGSPGHILIEKHISTRKRLSYWNKIDFGDIDSNINALQDQLLRLQNEPVSITQHNCLSDTNKQLEMWFDIKTEFYKQKSGDKFIVDMDNNSRYFHTLSNRRMFRKNIDCLYDVHEFQLLMMFQIVKDMAYWCSPGPDGFQAGFYHVNWDIVGNDIVQAVQSFFIYGYMPREFNKNYLYLIPKTDKANYPADFRPIGLCNTIYKILANRIKPYLKKIISPFQSAFVPGRAIQDNIIIAHEMIHTMQHKEGHTGSMAMKLDLPKAFDRLEWPFILGMLKKLGFPEKFCKYIEQCISTTEISIIFNGSPTSDHSPTRGLRQGDPLSPYLFIIVMDYLSRLLVNATTNHVIYGVKAARNAPAITHLLFADDILIFTKADRHNATGILNTLNQFGNISGQLLNLNKFSVYFSKNMSPAAKHDLTSALGMIEMQENDKYLGVTLLIGRDKSKAFKPLI
ncbi:uncharacterized protein LOC113273150 [Papaver somniferum]|uniref:uncharacterized protein LOC113273150 n=1 Tax=Papaver somniferum TaxID=3469 RepID=UPI000E6F55D8|nr:uncharacterized protein LOC113273150 [Papaver somniferum]